MIDELLGALLPARCLGCGARGRLLCARCCTRVRAAPAAPPPPGVDWWTSCFAYEGVVREVIARAKYRGERAALKPLGRLLAARIPFGVDIVTWAPASSSRYARSGVDHAALLARVVAGDLGIPARHLLTRAGDTPQTGKDAASRRRGPRLTLTHSPEGSRVLVIDDVATTGGTLTAASRALRERGVSHVFAATIARTPRPDERITNRAYTPSITPS
jgi:predicted amidophosphoribosyltransferase